MRFHRYPIQIWFLDEDLDKSAQSLTNKTLFKTIDGCYCALMSAHMYYIGIRSKKFYQHYFNKDNRQQTLDQHFPLWPLTRMPTFNSYDTRTSKWCRKCKEHYDYVSNYLSALLSEYSFRFNKSNILDKFVEWKTFDAPKLKIPEGHLKTIQLPWKCLNPKYRNKNIIEGYRMQYKHFVQDPLQEYNGSKRDVPEWLFDYNMVVV